MGVYYKDGEGDSTANKIYKAASQIISAMDSPSTTYIINATWPRYKSNIKKQQDIIDAAVSKAADMLKSNLKGKYRNIVVVYSGRALLNYLYYTGSHRAESIEPKAYSVYTDMGVVNDVIYGDGIHPTQLGSYIEAACYYSALYGNAQDIGALYPGGTRTSITLLNGNKGPNYASSYNQGKGFNNSIITQQGGFIADATMHLGMRLSSSSDGKAWKADSSKPNYNQMNLCTVSFNAGSTTPEIISEQTFEYGVKGQMFSASTEKTGYVLSGWSREENATAKEYSSDYSVSNALINSIIKDNGGKLALYAVWSPIKNTVTLDMQGGTGGTESVMAEYGAAMPSINIPARTGYTFGGYYSKANGEGKKYYNKNGNSSRTWKRTKNTKLYAKWIPEKYKVTLDMQGGTGGTKSVKVQYGADMPSVIVPVKTGYTFEGYYTKANGEGTKYYNSKGNPTHTWKKTKNTKLYAKWTPAKYTIKLDKQGGKTGSSKVKVQYGKKMASINIPSKTGYAFAGYYSMPNGDGTQYYKPDGTPCLAWDQTSGITLYAKWVLAGDVNDDGFVDSDDAMLLMQYNAGLITSEGLHLESIGYSQNTIVSEEDIETILQQYAGLHD